YVGLTRARDALWLASGEFYNHHATPLWPMLRDPQVLAAALPGSIVLDATPPPASLPWLPAEAEGEVPPARTPGRSLASDWWVYSFRSEEHTSELQSRENLVCRLLLEKKK